MSSDEGVGRVVAAIAAAIVSFCVVGAAVFYRVAKVGAVGLHGGPTTLAAAMAGLFGGGVVAVVVLILVLKFRRER